MNTKALFFGAITALLLTGAACSNDPEMDAVSPVFSSITIDPANPVAGDSVTCTVGYKSLGHHWYKAAFSWTLAGPANIKGTGTVVGSSNNPTFGFRIPKDSIGSYKLTFKPGYVHASCLFPSGSLENTSSIENGELRFNVKE